MNELALLQAIRLKGRVRPADIAATLGEDESAVGATVTTLAEEGLLTEGKSIRLTHEGRARLAELLADERAHIDTDEIARVYNDFRTVNADFKALVSEWQLREGEPNDHSDADYDAAVLGRLDGIQQAVWPVLVAATEQFPRLEAYSAKLSAALDNIRAGDASWFTRPIIDSYHTVWFELHEELIGAAGLTREQEASAGHAE